MPSSFGFGKGLPAFIWHLVNCVVLDVGELPQMAVPVCIATLPTGQRLEVATEVRTSVLVLWQNVGMLLLLALRRLIHAGILLNAYWSLPRRDEKFWRINDSRLALLDGLELPVSGLGRRRRELPVLPSHLHFMSLEVLLRHGAVEGLPRIILQAFRFLALALAPQGDRVDRARRAHV